LLNALNFHGSGSGCPASGEAVTNYQTASGVEKSTKCRKVSYDATQKTEKLSHLLTGNN